MYAVSAAFLTALRASHKVTTRLDSYTYGGGLLASDLRVSDGRVSVDASSDVRRTIEATIAADASLNVATVLSAYTTELRAWRGVVFPDGTSESVPLGRFRVDEVSVAADGTVKVRGPDRSKRVIDSRFTSPVQSVTSNSVVQEITRLVTTADATLTVSDRTGATTSTPSVLWDRDRWAAIDELAAAIGADIFFDADGVAVIALAPAVTDPVAWAVDAGESGVMIDFEAATSRDRTYNAVIATGERSDGTTPVRSMVTDSDPASPTYWSGPFGHVPRFYSSPLLTTTGQATAAARKILDRTRALNRQVRLSCICNPALDAGDVVTIRYPDSTFERHVVDSLTVPLDVASDMSLQTRSTQPDTE